MSSKIYPRAESGPAERLSWRQVGPDAGGSVESAAALESGGQIERRLDQARQEGIAQGIASAKTRDAAETAALAARVAETLAELASIRPRLRRQAEADLVKLAMAIARRILHRELAADPEALRGLVQAALEKLQAQEICRVRVHTSLEALLRSCLERYPHARAVELIADPALDRGAVVFETPRGNLDASVETQLREIGQGLADRLGRLSS